jgi:hypothetical protein
LLFAGCDDASTSNSEPKLPVAKSLEAEATSKAAAVSADGTTERNFGGAIFQIPAAWKEVPKKNDMISAEFVVPGPAGDGRLTLSSSGGTVQANIDRWKDQFFRGPNDPSPKESTLRAGGKDAHLVELFGSYQDMDPRAGRKSGQAMLGVVIPLGITERETNYFVKLTGPRETLSDARDTFLKFVETAKFKN